MIYPVNSAIHPLNNGGLDPVLNDDVTNRSPTLHRCRGKREGVGTTLSSLTWKINIFLLQDMFLHATQRKHKIRGSTFIKNNLGLTPLTLAAKLGRKEMFHEILEQQSMVRDDVATEDFVKGNLGS